MAGKLKRASTKHGMVRIALKERLMGQVKSILKQGGRLEVGNLRQK